MNDSRKQEIIEYLAERPRGSTIGEISEEMGMSRPTASKYLEILRAEEKIEQREVGRAKLHYIRENPEGVQEAESR
ncbi:MAG: winged helix-turn-helix domain-containing protein [Candidatus Nanosalina sp.]